MKTENITCDYCGKPTDNTFYLGADMGRDFLSNNLNVFFGAQEEKDMCKACVCRAINNLYWTMEPEFRLKKVKLVNP